MQKIAFGNDQDNYLSFNENVTVFGFGGNDTIVAEWNNSYYYTAVMYGGDGNDHYIFNGDYGVIVDTSGNDRLTLPGHSSDYVSAFINGQDLLLHNTWTGQEVMIVDAKGRGRIETITTESGETFNASQIESMVYSQGYGDLSYDQLAAMSGGLATAQQFRLTSEINKAWADLDWDSVWQQIADRGDLSPNAIAETLNANFTGRLSSEALQYWNEIGGQRALASSNYQGVEQNLPTQGSQPDISIIPHEAAENIALLYEAALDRLPDIGGLNFWIGEFVGGLTIESIADRFIDSDEFVSRFGVGSDEEFVDVLYLNVLDRPADRGGREYWLGEIEGGMSQGAVLNSFAISDENIENADWLAGLNNDNGTWVF